MGTESRDRPSLERILLFDNSMSDKISIAMKEGMADILPDGYMESIKRYLVIEDLVAALVAEPDCIPRTAVVLPLTDRAVGDGIAKYTAKQAGQDKSLKELGATVIFVGEQKDITADKDRSVVRKLSAMPDDLRPRFVRSYSDVGTTLRDSFFVRDDWPSAVEAAPVPPAAGLPVVVAPAGEAQLDPTQKFEKKRPTAQPPIPPPAPPLPVPVPPPFSPDMFPPPPKILSGSREDMATRPISVDEVRVYIEASGLRDDDPTLKVTADTPSAPIPPRVAPVPPPVVFVQAPVTPVVVPAATIQPPAIDALVAQFDNIKVSDDNKEIVRRLLSKYDDAEQPTVAESIFNSVSSVVRPQERGAYFDMLGVLAEDGVGVPPAGHASPLLFAFLPYVLVEAGDSYYHFKPMLDAAFRRYNDLGEGFSDFLRGCMDRVKAQDPKYAGEFADFLAVRIAEDPSSSTERFDAVVDAIRGLGPSGAEDKTHFYRTVFRVAGASQVLSDVVYAAKNQEIVEPLCAVASVNGVRGKEFLSESIELLRRENPAYAKDVAVILAGIAEQNLNGACTTMRDIELLSNLLPGEDNVAKVAEFYSLLEKEVEAKSGWSDVYSVAEQLSKSMGAGGSAEQPPAAEVPDVGAVDVEIDAEPAAEPISSDSILGAAVAASGQKKPSIPPPVPAAASGEPAIEVKSIDEIASDDLKSSPQMRMGGFSGEEFANYVRVYASLLRRVPIPDMGDVRGPVMGVVDNPAPQVERRNYFKLLGVLGSDTVKQLPEKDRAVALLTKYLPDFARLMEPSAEFGPQDNNIARMVALGVNDYSGAGEDFLRESRLLIDKYGRDCVDGYVRLFAKIAERDLGTAVAKMEEISSLMPDSTEKKEEYLQKMSGQLMMNPDADAVDIAKKVRAELDADYAAPGDAAQQNADDPAARPAAPVLKIVPSLDANESVSPGGSLEDRVDVPQTAGPQDTMPGYAPVVAAGAAAALVGAGASLLSLVKPSADKPAEHQATSAPDVSAGAQYSAGYPPAAPVAGPSPTAAKPDSNQAQPGFFTAQSAGQGFQLSGEPLPEEYAHPQPAAQPSAQRPAIPAGATKPATEFDPIAFADEAQQSSPLSYLFGGQPSISGRPAIPPASPAAGSAGADPAAKPAVIPIQNNSQGGSVMTGSAQNPNPGASQASLPAPVQSGASPPQASVPQPLQQAPSPPLGPPPLPPTPNTTQAGAPSAQQVISGPAPLAPQRKGGNGWKYGLVGAALLAAGLGIGIGVYSLYNNDQARAAYHTAAAFVDSSAKVPPSNGEEKARPVDADESAQYKAPAPRAKTSPEYGKAPSTPVQPVSIPNDDYAQMDKRIGGLEKGLGDVNEEVAGLEKRLKTVEVAQSEHPQEKAVPPPQPPGQPEVAGHAKAQEYNPRQGTKAPQPLRAASKRRVDGSYHQGVGHRPRHVGDGSEHSGTVVNGMYIVPIRHYE